ncbi:hypothetical protein OPTIMUS_217 [Mycobacterium phage Optimus]|uniref:Uncharacterized protein n=2 Tax=Omegavirus TaxID=1623292 RepID=G8I5T0_9CAUD|nr:hypothetical protein N860_gp195 [Mycobacterium phage Redno2]YP_009012122.1 hypothetical protein CM09_gp199 [Mycobacterium phage Courthouse]YP_009205356.1 hypothetical protein AVT17_gp204 [Mycobacterium phage Ariel]YP_009591072.1 hypothetical protein FDG54_gp196 [Mycobacterium phage Optimus]AXQ52212.1 hypothetical protein SEA_EJIMIX_213 [Mycobacterium phage Ejimix]AXQ62619.1 hypothetical protein SEA_ZELINK_214 [Mycobacterium phage Zelink]QZD98093.1 hypothetical protein SEA_BEEM_223 [Mycobac
MSVTWRIVAKELSADQLRAWLDNHQSAIDAGLNVGQIQRDKAQAFTVELARRT